MRRMPALVGLAEAARVGWVAGDSPARSLLPAGCRGARPARGAHAGVHRSDHALARVGRIARLAASSTGCCCNWRRCNTRASAPRDGARAWGRISPGSAPLRSRRPSSNSCMQSGWAQLPLTIGYDSRINADKVAQLVAEVAVANGLHGASCQSRDALAGVDLLHHRECSAWATMPV